MNLVDGKLYWTEKNGILYQYPYLTEDIECEVAIIGGGITGALCAYYFTEAKVDTVLIEKSIVGHGSTSASTSLLDYEVDFDLVELQKMIGVDQANHSYDLCKKALDDLESITNNLEDQCEFKRKDIFYYTDTKEDIPTMREEFFIRKANGYDVEWLDSDNADQYFSFLVEGGILTRNTAGEVDPYLLTHILLKHATQTSLRIFENTEIIDLNWQKDGVILVTNYEQRIKAKKVIIATGYDYKNFLKENIVTLNRTYTIVTTPIQDFTGWYNQSLIRDNKNVYTYLRTTADQRIIIGGGDTPYGNTLNLQRLAEQRYKSLSDRLLKMFPQIPNIQTEYQFTGLFGETKDGLPYIGTHEGQPNCYYCLGYGSNGVLYGVLGGQILRDLYFGNRWADLDLFRFDRSHRNALIGV